MGFKQWNYLRLERWSDSAAMKRDLKRRRSKAARRVDKAIVNEEG